jgi:hypothetical protein
MLRWRKKEPEPKVPPAPDLASQFEDLLDAVWGCEKAARLVDRLDAQARFDELRGRRQPRRRS